MTLTKLPGSKWWVETDDVTSEIIGTYNRAFITADIQACNNTLANLPDPSREATDVAGVLNLIDKSAWTDARKARVTTLVNEMYSAYQGVPQSLETAQLIAKRDALVILRNRLV